MNNPVIFKDKTFLLTGKLPNFTRQQAAELITQRGGVFTDKWTKTINYLLVGEKPGTKLHKTNNHNVYSGPSFSCNHKNEDYCLACGWRKIIKISETEFAAVVLVNSPDFVPRKNITVPVQNTQQQVIHEVGGRSFDFED